MTAGRQRMARLKEIKEIKEIVSIRHGCDILRLACGELHIWKCNMLLRAGKDWKK